MSSQLHPSVAEFKEFVGRYPKLIQEVRQKGESWQPYYEKWVLLGEEDPYWEQFNQPTEQQKANTQDVEQEQEEDNDSGKNKEMMGQFMNMIENVDLNKVQGHIQQLNGAISNIQNLVGQFQDMKKTNPSKGNTPKRSPFGFGRD
ncbi:MULTISPECIES: YlbD family protein [Pontibacillus]|uniref:YlbD family protein n=1 Tax=Pontibacillus chungwhensis TaxID=265426 RepID=A0ABY8V1K5_9BACI|nr:MULTISPECIES: YlbD family protein [Pontibacillus]MCD5322561.1 YlbD family protein [Pontibacillus sp. HN14]WIF99846.1 YlbD family protein [Pontibacillus chungwhensis]